MMELPWEEIRRTFERALLNARTKTEPLLHGGGEVLLVDSNKDIVALIDRVSGEAIREYLREHCPVPCALMSEEGSTFEDLHPHPQIRIITDEIDGTRPARMKIPTCGICLAAFPIESDQTLKDVKVGALATMTDDLFSFERGAGIWRDREPWRPKSTPPNLAQLRYLYDNNFGFPALTGLYLKDFNISHRYGVMAIVSIVYCTRTLLLGGADFYTNLNIRLEKMWPALKPHMTKMHGMALGEYPWDLAANVPLLWEAGFIATHSDGTSLENASLIDGSYENIHDLLTSRTAAVHEKVVAALAHQEERLLARKEEVTALLLDLAT